MPPRSHVFLHLSLSVYLGESKLFPQEVKDVSLNEHYGQTRAKSLCVRGRGGLTMCG